VAWSVVGSGATQILQLVVGVVLARLLGREAFGLLSMAMVVTGLAQVVSEAGLGPVLVQRQELPRRLLDTVFWAGLLLGLSEMGLLWISAPAVAGLLRAPAVAGVLRGCAPVLLLGPVGLVHRWLLARDLGFRALARIEVLAALAGAAAALALAFRGAGVEALVARVTVTAAATAALAWLTHPWRPALCWDGAALRAVLPYGSGVIGTEILNQAAQNVDFFLVGRYLGAGPLGEYSLAYSLATLPQGRLGPLLARVMFPVFSRAQEDDAALRRGYTRFVAVMAAVSFPLLTFLAVLGPTLLPVVYGTQWRGAVRPLPALCAAGAAYALATTVGSLYRAKGRPDLELLTTAVRACLLSGCVAAGLFGWGTTRAVATAVALYAAGSTLLFQPVANRLIGLRMRDYLAAVAPAAVGSAAWCGAALAVRAVMEHKLTAAQAVALAGALSTIGVLALWRAVSPSSGESVPRIAPRPHGGRPE
jgi:O-antigen/teichoic acid export membrane protein